MRQLTRREVLVTFAIASTAGCNDLRSSITDAIGNDTSSRGKTVERISETVDIPSGSHKAYAMHFTEQTVLTYTVVTNKEVDIIVFAEAEYKKYRNEAAEKLTYASELSELNTTVTGRGANVTASKPVLVIDNTKWAKASPASNVRAYVDLHAFVRKS